MSLHLPTVGRIPADTTVAELYDLVQKAQYGHLILTFVYGDAQDELRHIFIARDQAAAVQSSMPPEQTTPTVKLAWQQQQRPLSDTTLIRSNLRRTHSVAAHTAQSLEVDPGVEEQDGLHGQLPIAVASGSPTRHSYTGAGAEDVVRPSILPSSSPPPSDSDNKGLVDEDLLVLSNEQLAASALADLHRSAGSVPDRETVPTLLPIGETATRETNLVRSGEIVRAGSAEILADPIETPRAKVAVVEAEEPSRTDEK